MDVIGDLVARDRRSEAIAVRVASRAGSYSYEKYCTISWKAGNLLRHYGVRDDATVAVDAGDGTSPPPYVTLMGASLLGATVQFDPGAGLSAETKALLVPADRIEAYDPDPGVQVLAYGDTVDDPTVSHFEREVWSENPTAPPDVVAPDQRALVTADGSHSHAELLDAAESVVTEYDLDADASVAVRAPLARPGTVAAGVLAPLLAGGEILLDRETTGSVAVGDGPEERTIDPNTVL